ncbi:MAG: hypothetical protein RI894_101 [Bacteroidota bacterium]
MAKTKDELNRIRERWGERFIRGDYTQAEISELTGISQKTISVWARTDQWQERKNNRVGTMQLIGEQASAEMEELNRAIQARPEGLRYATSEECNIKLKNLKVIQLAFAGVTFPDIIDVCEKIIKFTGKNHPEFRETMLSILDKFQQEEQNRYK